MRRFFLAFAIGFLVPSAAFSADPLIAIDILLEPDEAMLAQAKADNARLRESVPQGFTLDATHIPHVSVLQCYVHTKDLDKVVAAVREASDVRDPIGMELKTTGYFYIPWEGRQLAGISISRTPQLLQYQQAVLAAIIPFAVKGGTVAAFVPNEDGAKVGEVTAAYVDSYIPHHTGEHYGPHVTIGVGREDVLQAMIAAPYIPLVFEIRRASVYHLGDFGTARKELGVPEAAEPPKSGEVRKEYYPDGKLMSEETYKGGKKNGVCKLFDSGGRLERESTFEDDVQAGVDKRYFSGGNLKQESFFKGGKLEGEAKTYYANGKLCDQGAFAEGKKDGPWKHYDEKGALLSESFWRAGSKHASKTYENGKLEAEYTFKDDQMNGPYKVYDRQGGLREEGNYENGKEQGVVKTYYGKGQLKSVSHYQEGKLEGPAKTYRPDGSGALTAEWNYRRGKPEGVITTYYDEGVLLIKYQDTYEDGRRIKRKAYGKEGNPGFEKDYPQPSQGRKPPEDH